ISDRIQEVWRHRRFAARELNRHLPARFNRNRIIEQLLDFFPRQFVYKTHLVCIHKTRIAHHVATVGQVYSEDGTSTVLDCATAMIVQGLVVMSPDIAAWEYLFEVFKEVRVDSHDVFEVPVNWAILDHQYFSIALNYLGFDLPDLLIPQYFYWNLAIQNLVA